MSFRQRTSGFDSERRKYWRPFRVFATEEFIILFLCGLLFNVSTLLASYVGESGSIPGGVAPGCSHARIVPDVALVGGFSRVFPVSTGLAFWRRSILTSSPKSLHSTLLGTTQPNAAIFVQTKFAKPMRVIEVSMEQRRNARAGETGVAEKTRRPGASSGTIRTCKNTGGIRSGIEPSSPWWEASILTAQPPKMPVCTRVKSRAATPRARDRQAVCGGTTGGVLLQFTCATWQAVNGTDVAALVPGVHGARLPLATSVAKVVPRSSRVESREVDLVEEVTGISNEKIVEIIEKEKIIVEEEIEKELIKEEVE
ncbi:hypothetical protein PR048_019820 [Dryococelus australis]|uniref:Uncharacterized protein n=1 Tax=Dryococelus australis TaxID=614101 RepID=A0ABQ9H4I2_9NEOP|nr:hypothetical protein PR048_019820 [Dryococelus australis]